MRPFALVLPSLRGGGAERNTLTLARLLVEAGRPVHLVVVDPRGELASVLPPGVHLVPVVSVPAAADAAPLRVRSAVPGLLRYLRETKPAVVWSTFAHTHVLLVAATRLLGLDSRVVLRLGTSLEKTSSALIRRLLPMALERGHVVFANCAAIAREAETATGWPPGTVRVVPNLLDLEALDAAALATPAPSGLPAGDGPLVVCAGRLVEQKDPLMAFAAFAALERADVRLVFAGVGPLRAELERMIARSSVRDRVAVLGFRTDLPALLRSAVCLLLASRHEGLANVLLEALALGCTPVVTAHFGGSAELLDSGRYGYIANRPTADGLADALARALAAPIEPHLLRERAVKMGLAETWTHYQQLLEPLGHPGDEDEPAS